MKKIFSLFAAVLFAAGMMADNFELFSGALEEGDYLITYDDCALKASITSNRFDYAEVTATAGVVADPAAELIWHIEKSGDYWTIYNADANKYAGSTSKKNQGALLDAVTDNAKWEATGSETYEFANVARAAGSDSGNKWLRKNGTYGFACYASGTGGALTLYKLQSGEAPAVAKPAIAGKAKFVGETEVTFSCETEGAKIYYTLNGEDPDAEATEYLGLAVKLTESTTVKAIAILDEVKSAIAEKTFTYFEAKTCAEAAALDANVVTGLNEVTVTYVNGGNIYVKDATGYELIYAFDFGLAAGDVVKGFIGKSSPYNGLPELKPEGIGLADLDVVHGDAPAPEEITAAPTVADINKYLTIKGVSFKTAEFDKKNITAVLGEEEFVVRNNFNLEITFDTKKKYDLVGAGAIFNTTLQLYLISAEEQKEEPTAVDNTEVNTKAVKFFENGQLVIIKNGVKYNATGAIVK